MTFNKRTTAATALAFVALAAFGSAVGTGRIYGFIPDVQNNFCAQPPPPAAPLLSTE